MTAADSRVGMTFGKYQITSLLGKGGMGEVYAAYDTDKDRTVALKVLADPFSTDERFRTRFKRESHAAAKLQEPHVIPIHDWGEIDGNLYIDMRLVRGSSLHELLEKGPLAPPRAGSIVSQIAAALDAAHAEGLIHRDVKPANIMVTPADFAYLLDFGIAEAKGDTKLTMARTQIGSFAYMAPERFNDLEATPASDVYSLACVLYEALTGDTPFRADSLERVVAAHLASPPPRPSVCNSAVPTAFDDVIARGMAKEPDDRYGSAGALGRAAQRALRAESRASSDAPTLLPRPVALPYAIHTGPVPQSGPPTDPTLVRERDAGERSRQWLLPAVIGIAAALILAAIGVVIGLLAGQRSGQSGNPSPTVAYTPPAPTAVYPPPAPTVYPPAPPPSTASPNPGAPTWAVPSTAAPVPQDPGLQLAAIANSDRPYVTRWFADRWVPQISSKRPGMAAEGVVWDSAKILQEHQWLRQKYGANLLWSGDWSTFDSSNFWVTIASVSFPDSAGALNWCRNQGLDRDHCFAKLISTTHAVPGSTAYN